MMLEEISTVARAQHWESGRRGKGGRGRKVAYSYAGSDEHGYAGTDTGDARVDK